MVTSFKWTKQLNSKCPLGLIYRHKKVRKTNEESTVVAVPTTIGSEGVLGFELEVWIETKAHLQGLRFLVDKFIGIYISSKKLTRQSIESKITS